MPAVLLLQRYRPLFRAAGGRVCGRVFPGDPSLRSSRVVRFAWCGTERMGFPVWLHSELAVGQRRLRLSFSSSAARTLKAGETVGTASGSNGGIHHLRAGWAGQFPALVNGCRAIVDVYPAGDVVGLDTLLRTRPLENVLTLTSVTVETIPARDALTEWGWSEGAALFGHGHCPTGNGGAGGRGKAVQELEAGGLS
jgi:hypothetical protein